MRKLTSLLVLLSFMFSTVVQAAPPVDREGRISDTATTYKDLTADPSGTIAPGYLKLYPRNGKFYTKNSANVVAELTGGSGEGGINYITKGNAEADDAASEWTQYNDMFSNDANVVNTATDTFTFSNLAWGFNVYNGMPVRIDSSATTTAPGGLTYRTTIYYIRDYAEVGANSSFKLTLFPGGTVVDITSVGSPNGFDINFYPLVPRNRLGTGTGTTWTREVSPAYTPLVGTGSFLFTKGAAFKAGTGWYKNFTVDARYRSSRLTFTLDYSFVAGAANYACDSTSLATSGFCDIVYSIYDATTGALVGGPWQLPKHLVAEGQTLNLRFDGNGSTSYRVFQHYAGSGTTALGVLYDSFKVSPQVVQTLQSREVGEVFYTRLSTCPVGSVAATGQTAPSSFTAYSIATLPDLRGVFIRGAGSSTQGGQTFTGTLGNFQLDQFESHNHQQSNSVAGGGSNSYQNLNANGSQLTYLYTANTGGTETNPANVSLTACIQVTPGNLALSSDVGFTPTVISAVTGGTSLPNTESTFGLTGIRDKSSQVSGTTITLFKNETVKIHAHTVTQNSGVADDNIIRIYVNGVSVKESGTTGSFLVAADAEYIYDGKAGDVISFRGKTVNGTRTMLPAYSHFSVETYSGAQTIGILQKQRAIVNITTAMTVDTAGQLVIATAVKNDGNMYASGWVTCPANGTLAVRLSVRYDTVNNKGGTQQAWLATPSITKVRKIGGVRISGAAVQALEYTGQGITDCKAGDQYGVRLYGEQGGTLDGDSANNYVDWTFEPSGT